MTTGRFDPMNEQERRELARRLADVSDVIDYETALRIAQSEPAKAEELIQMRVENKRRQEERARTLEELHLAAQEFR
ncbi:MAG: hypothetical protein ACJ76D_01115 [Solirubrobacterales bacterium]